MFPSDLSDVLTVGATIKEELGGGSGTLDFCFRSVEDGSGDKWEELSFFGFLLVEVDVNGIEETIKNCLE